MLDVAGYDKAVNFAAKILMLSEKYNFSVTSWIRTVNHNADLPGSVGNSQHLLGLAVDIVRDAGCDKAALIEAAKNLGLHIIDEKDHIHLQEPRV